METSTTSLIFDFLRLDKIVYFLVGLSAIIIFSKLLNLWSEKIQEKFTGKRLFILQLTTIISFILYLVGTITLFYIVFRPTKEVLVTMGGSAAVAIGFALKEIVESIIAGFILLFDKPFQVGDRVSFGDQYGEIKSIGLRSVRLQTLNDDLVTIPNSKFLSDVVASGNSGELDMMVTTSFYISVKEDLSKVKKLLHEVVITSRYVFLEKPVAIVFEEVSASNNFVIKATVKSYVLDVKFEKSLQSDIVTRGNKLLNEEGIQRPSNI